jgi:hypothetical protein
MTLQEIATLVANYEAAARTFDRQDVDALVRMCEEDRRIAELLPYFQGLLHNCEDAVEGELLVSRIKSLEARKLQCAEWITAIQIEWRNPFA